MVLDIATVIQMIRDNVRRTGLPIPASRKDLSSWSENVEIERQGKIILYTGALYQLLPRIDALARQLEKIEKKSSGKTLFKVAGKLGRITGLAASLLKPDKQDVEYANLILASITRLLYKAGVKVAYNPEIDGYSGVLLYDLGLDDDFREHAEKEGKKIMRQNPELIITVDPHTTHVLKKVYPELFPWFDVEVRSYLEVLAENVENIRWRPVGEKVTIHDPCFYARYEGIIKQPRLLLEAAGYSVVNPRRWGRLTYCCGGPIESVSPSLSRRIAERRIEELSETEAPVVAVMCPICLANLRRASRNRIRVEDISVLLARGAGLL